MAMLKVLTQALFFKYTIPSKRKVVLKKLFYEYFIPLLNDWGFLWQNRYN